MTVVILHHHLHPGGVTRVLESQIRAIRKTHPATNVKLLVGDWPESFDHQDVEIAVEPVLDYLDDGLTETELRRLKGLIDETLTGHVHPDDVLHAHNLNLGKNPLLTLAVRDLIAADRASVLVHCHDFIEDRPANLAFAKGIVEAVFNEPWERAFYPRSPNVHFATLTTSDKNRLLAAGVEVERVTVLPNPVDFGTMPDVAFDSTKIRSVLGLRDDKPIIVYPVRVIRRKNIGEFILLATLFEDRAEWLVTQPPKNPVEIEPYQRWRTFCREREIPVVFEAGTKVPFVDIMRAADRCVTTSVMEGFGMVYLEPWLFDAPVAGRNIPSVTRDLTRAGMRFPLLYDEIAVTVDDSRADFKNLPPERQMELIDLIRTDYAAKMAIIDDNPILSRMLDSAPGELVENNQRVIRDAYSLKRYGDLLHAVHQKLDRSHGRN